MGDVGDYTVDLKPTSEVENLYSQSYTSYGVKINELSQSSVDLSINDYPTPIVNNVREAIKNGTESLPQSCGEPMIINREIDGKPGTLCSMSCSDSSEVVLFISSDILSIITP